MDRISKVFAGAGSGSMRARAWWRALRGQSTSAAGHWALRDVSLHVKPGESVGLIGDNGAGKSTLLKIMAGVLRPSSGSVTSSGTLAPLLELGAGFNPDFSGRENLKLGAALMGVRAAQLKRHLPAIEAFAELGEHLDRPLKHYSSGMVMRLGFALASTLKPDLLITDEVLAVGDESFQRKCNRWVDGYVAEGGTLLLVSHSMDQIRRLCRRTYWLKDGRVEMEGDTDQVVDAYLADHASRGVLEPDADYSGAHYRLTELEINTVDGQLMDADELVISAQIHSPDNRPPVVALGIKDRHNTPVYGLTSEMDQVQPQNLGNRRYGFKLKVDVGQLLPGPYQVTGHAMDPEALRLFDTAIRHFVIAGDAVNTDCDGGFIRL